MGFQVIADEYEESVYSYFKNKDQWVRKQLAFGMTEADLVELDLRDKYPKELILLDFFGRTEGYFHFRVVRGKLHQRQRGRTFRTSKTISFNAVFGDFVYGRN